MNSIELTRAIASALSIPDDAVAIRDYADEIFAQIEPGPTTVAPSIDTRRRLVRRLEDELTKEVGRRVRIVVLPSGIHGAREQFILDAVNRRFPNLVRDLIISFDDSGPFSIWVTTERALRSIEADKIKAGIRDVAEAAEMELDQVVIVGYEGPVPSPPAVLRQIKLREPVTAEVIAESLQREGFGVPHGRWLNRQLDRLRESGHITLLSRRTKEAPIQYAITHKGLLALPSEKGRVSSDVIRALEFGRKRW